MRVRARMRAQKRAEMFGAIGSRRLISEVSWLADLLCCCVTPTHGVSFFDFKPVCHSTPVTKLARTRDDLPCRLVQYVLRKGGLGHVGGWGAAVR